MASLSPMPTWMVMASLTRILSSTVKGRRLPRLPQPSLIQFPHITPQNIFRISEEYRDRAAEADYKICRSLGSAAARRRCWASAADRDAARVSGRPVPPLVTESKFLLSLHLFHCRILDAYGYVIQS